MLQPCCWRPVLALPILSLLLLPTATATHDAIESAHREIWKRFIDRHGIMVDFTALDGTVALPSPDECRQGKPNALGWFQPIENGGMFTGIYIDAAIQRAIRTRDPADEKLARRLLDGLLLLNSVSEIKGFVARGVSSDGRSHFPMGSNDQTLPWFYGLWRFWRAPFATPDERDRIATRLRETADVIAANGWKMPAEQPFGTRGGFGGIGFDSTPRRLFVMKLMHEVTGEPRWQAMYRQDLETRDKTGNRPNLDICERGMVFHYDKTHNWTSCTAVAALRGLWELEEDPLIRAAFGRGLVASGQLAAECLPSAEHFDPAVGKAFENDWRKSMMPLWKPQSTEKEAEALAIAQLQAFMKVSPRRHAETAWIREPTAAAWIITLCPEKDLIQAHAPAIQAMAARYDYTQLHYCTFFWVEAAWERLEQLGLSAGSTETRRPSDQ